jgi:hypothetical protein
MAQVEAAGRFGVSQTLAAHWKLDTRLTEDNLAHVAA